VSRRPPQADPAVFVVGAGVVAVPARVIVPGFHLLPPNPVGCARTTSCATRRLAASEDGGMARAAPSGASGLLSPDLG
jgi:hypothetical protein